MTHVIGKTLSLYTLHFAFYTPVTLYTPTQPA